MGAAADNLPTALAAVSGQLHRGIEAAAKIQGMYAEPAAPQADRFSITFNVGGTGGSTIEGQVVRALPVTADLEAVDARGEDVVGDDGAAALVEGFPAPTLAFEIKF